MVVKASTNRKATQNKYRVVTARKQQIITARNIQEAYAKAKRLFPRARLVTVSREPSKKGKEYETYIIHRQH